MFEKDKQSACLVFATQPTKFVSRASFHGKTDLSTRPSFCVWISLSVCAYSWYERASEQTIRENGQTNFNLNLFLPPDLTQQSKSSPPFVEK